ncbi:hypothetical protein HYU11_06200 [Candidatus Woesearchaeota archaeon]|nr:hypothetical protein [Candidatus Woesearchaeota archaeon]
MITIYTSCSAVYAFDEGMKLVDKKPFAPERLAELENNEWLQEEKDLIQKHKKDKIYFLGFKKEKIEGVVFTQDIRKLEKASPETDFGKLRISAIHESKKKIKKSVQKDWLIIQASNSIDDLTRTTNLLAKRLREWYELYNPEFSKAEEDHEKFIMMITAQKRDELLGGIGLSEESSMGGNLSSEDIKIITALGEEIKMLYALKEAEKLYLERLMDEICPNTKTVAGALIGAKLISLAGSFKRLAQLPASTIQLLGAEKALFRHMKTGARSPKYGVIFSHPVIQTSKRALWGKAGRALADKLAIAAKVDYFKGKFIGDKLLKELEMRFK